MSPVGAVFVPFPPNTGTNLLHPPPPPQSLNGSWEEATARSPNPRKCDDEESYGKVQRSAGEGHHGMYRMPGVFKARWRVPCGGKP